MSNEIDHLMSVQELVRLWVQSREHCNERPPDWLLEELTRATDAVRKMHAATEDTQ